MNRTRSFGLDGKRRKAGYYKRYFLFFIRENWLILLFGFLFIFGVWIGTSFIGSFQGETLDQLLILLNGFVSRREGQEMRQTFLSTFFSSFWPAALLFFCGFCAISQPLIALVPFFKGLGFGLSASTMLGIYGSSAMGYLIVLLLPGTILSTLVLLFCCKESLGLSCMFFQVINPLQMPSEGTSVGDYCVKYIIFTACLAGTSALESLLFQMFSSYFAL